MNGKDFGFDAFAIIQATHYNRQMQMNRFDLAPNDVVKTLTGREPEDFETITRQYFDNSLFKRRTFATWLSTFIKFGRMPFTRVPSKKRRTDINR